MSQLLDDTTILNDTVRDNGTMQYTLPDGHIVKADIGDGEPAGSVYITWCETVRDIALSREDAKTEEARNIKEATRSPQPSSEAPVQPLEYAEHQVRAFELMHERVSQELREAMTLTDQLAEDLKEVELSQRQWQAILDSLELGLGETPTDAEDRLEKTREEP